MNHGADEVEGHAVDMQHLCGMAVLVPDNLAFQGRIPIRPHAEGQEASHTHTGVRPVCEAGGPGAAAVVVC